MDSNKIIKKARRLHTHSVTFDDVLDKLVVARAIQGKTTKAIASEFGISESKVQYRIQKAQNGLRTHFRDDYRNGKGYISNMITKHTESLAIKFVENKVTSFWHPYGKE